MQEIKPPRGNQSWVQVAETIEALNPYVIEAYDENGGLIRAIRDDQEGYDEDDSPSTTQVSAEADIPSALATDPETARLTHFANLLYRSNRFAMEIAFTKMVQLFELSEQRSQSIESRLERTETAYRRALQQQVDDAFDQAADLVANQTGQNGGDAKQAMIETFMKSAMQAHFQKEAAAKAAAPNGTHKPNGGTA